MMYAMKLMYQTILRLLAVILMTAGLFGGVSPAYAITGNGQPDNPYVITNLDDWEFFCHNRVNSGSLRNAYAELADDITVTITSSDNYASNIMCGISYYPFIGHFDGKGHTLTFNCDASNQHVSTDEFAPFRCVAGGATIVNLRVAGTINTPKAKAAGFIATCQFNHSLDGSRDILISNCVSSITINSTYNGDGSHGGFISCNTSDKINIIFDNCLFNGKLLGSTTYSCGGFEGAGYNTSIKNCLFAPSQLSVNTNGCATFSRATKGSFSNCYYLKALGTVQGTDATSLSSAVIAEKLGDNWIAHNDTVYLKSLAQYVDMIGWVQDGTPDRPSIVGGYGGNPRYYFKGVTDANYTLFDPPNENYYPTAPGEYIVKLETSRGSGTNGWWNPWCSTMNFCIVKPPVGVTSSIGYDGMPKNLLQTAGDPIVNTCKFYYKVDADGTWTDDMNAVQAINAGNHTVYYYVKGDATHNDIGSETDPACQIVVRISPQNVVLPTIEVSSITYTGSPLEPTVVVKAEDGVILDPSEYNVTYENNTNAGTGTVYITNKDGGNYTVYNATGTFQILKAEPTYTAPTANTLTYNREIQQLITLGSTSDGIMQYGINPDNMSPNAIPTGTEAGKYLTYYKVVGDANHNDYGPIALEVTISPKKVDSPEILISPDVYYYDGTAKQPTVTLRDDGTVISSTEYTVKYSDNTNAGTATVTIIDNEGGNYTVSGTAHFSILAQTPGVTPPTPISGLIYNTNPQNLILVGTAVGGTMEYSFKPSSDYSTNIPQGTDAQQYEVFYRVKGDENHADREPASVFATISPKTVSSPIISLSSTSFVYDGTEKKPDVTVKDGETVIPDSEYTVEYSNNTNVGTAMVVIMDKSGGNYIVNGSTTFMIVAAGAGVTPPTAKTDLVYNGTAQQLIVAGSVEGGTMEYSLDRNSYSIEIPTGIDAKEYKVYYRVKGDSNHADETDVSVSVTISPKTLSKPDIILNPTTFTFDGSEKTPTVTVKDGEITVPATEYTVSYSDNKNVGTATVTLTDNDGGNYNVSGTANFSIVGAVAGVTLPTAITGLVYNTKAQELVIAGSAVGGTMQYSLDNKTYSTKVPTGTNADQYTVYCRVVGDDNHVSMDPVSLIVTISPKALSSPTIILTPSLAVYDGKEQKPEVVVKDGEDLVPASEYTVTYSDNIEVGTARVTLTDNSGGNYTVSAMVTFMIYDPSTGFIAPVAISGLVYNGKAQNLVVAGTGVGGTLQYSLDGKNYSPLIPTATDAGTYKVYYKVVTNNGMGDINTGSVTVIISPKMVALSITLQGAPESVPVITVVDGQGNLLTSNDYTAVITDGNGHVVTPKGNKLAVGYYVLTVKPVGNYSGPAVSVSFHVRRAYSFVFTMKSDLIAVILPFDREVPNGYHTYFFDRVGDDGNPVFKRILAEKMTGGEPYLLKYEGSSASRSETRADRTIDLSPSSPGLIDVTIPIQSQVNQNMVFTGSFDDMTNTKALTEGAYLLQSDNTWKPLDSSKASQGDNVCQEAFLAYIRFKDRSTPKSSLTATLEPKKSDDPDDPDDPDGVNAVILEDEYGHQEWYDLQGRRMEAPQKGINILRSEDGKTKKVIVR